MDDRDLPRGISTPSPDVVVGVHFDGACEGGHGGTIATYGFTVEGGGFRHDESGLAVPPFHERATNNVAEYVAAIRSLEWLRSAGCSGDVVLAGDSQLVVRQMTGEYDVKTDHLRPYHDRLVQLASGFRHVEFRWIPREENVRADALSKEALARAHRELPETRGPERRPTGHAELDEPG